MHARALHYGYCFDRACEFTLQRALVIYLFDELAYTELLII